MSTYHEDLREFKLSWIASGRSVSELRKARRHRERNNLKHVMFPPTSTDIKEVDGSEKNFSKPSEIETAECVSIDAPPDKAGPLIREERRNESEQDGFYLDAEDFDVSDGVVNESDWNRVTLVATDTTNLWGNANQWLKRLIQNGKGRENGIRVEFLGEDRKNEEENVSVVFRYFNGSDSQFGVTCNEREWCELVAGASKRNPKEFHVRYSVNEAQ